MANRSTAYQFWRPTLLATGIGVAVIGLCFLLRGDGSDDGRQVGPFSSLALPSPARSPAEVIRIQIEALRQVETPGLGALQCYCFAAPSNRVVTGPLARFGRMVRNPPFSSIGDCQTYSIGKESFARGVARSLVVTVSPDRRMRTFVWVLERQTETPFEDCWMTVGVFLVGESPELAPNPPQDSDLAAGQVGKQFASFLHPYGVFQPYKNWGR